MSIQWWNDDDSRAYQAVVDAMRLPRATEEEQDARRAAVQTAMLGATRVPLETMRFCQQALGGAVVVAAHGHRNAATDTGTAVELLAAALRSAGMNVDVNLQHVSDRAFVARVERLDGQTASIGEQAAVWR